MNRKFHASSTVVRRDLIDCCPLKSPLKELLWVIKINSLSELVFAVEGPSKFLGHGEVPWRVQENVLIRGAKRTLGVVCMEVSQESENLLGEA